MDLSAFWVGGNGNQRWVTDTERTFIRNLSWESQSQREAGDPRGSRVGTTLQVTSQHWPGEHPCGAQTAACVSSPSDAGRCSAAPATSRSWTWPPQAASSLARMGSAWPLLLHLLALASQSKRAHLIGWAGVALSLAAMAAGQEWSPGHFPFYGRRRNSQKMERSPDSSGQGGWRMSTILVLLDWSVLDIWHLALTPEDSTALSPLQPHLSSPHSYPLLFSYCYLSSELPLLHQFWQRAAQDKAIDASPAYVNSLLHSALPTAVICPSLLWWSKMFASLNLNSAFSALCICWLWKWKVSRGLPLLRLCK